MLQVHKFGFSDGFGFSSRSPASARAVYETAPVFQQSAPARRPTKAEQTCGRWHVTLSEPNPRSQVHRSRRGSPASILYTRSSLSKQPGEPGDSRHCVPMSAILVCKAHLRGLRLKNSMCARALNSMPNVNDCRTYV